MPNTQSNPSQLNPWDYKPWWCQPWSVLLTGLGLILGSWLFSHRYWLTGLVAFPVCIWMGFFLLIWPKLVVRSLVSVPECLENSSEKRQDSYEDL